MSCCDPPPHACAVCTVTYCMYCFFPSELPSSTVHTKAPKTKTELLYAGFKLPGSRFL